MAWPGCFEDELAAQMSDHCVPYCRIPIRFATRSSVSSA